MSSDNHVIELLPGYVLGCLDEEDMVLVSEHLPVCADCQAELYTYQAVADGLVLALPDATPPSSLKRQLANRIRLSLVQSPPSRWNVFTDFIRNTSPIWGIASLLLIIALATSSLLLWQRVNHLETITQPKQMQTINLAGTQTAPDASGLIVLSMDGKHGTLVVDHLPVLDPKHEYQLWLIHDGQRASGGVFSVNKYGYGSVWVSSPEPLNSYSDFGISIEPMGGSPGPTGDKVLGKPIN